MCPGAEVDVAAADAGQFRYSQAHTLGGGTYPGATRLLITVDSGGSSGSRLRLWNSELAEFATRTGLAMTVCHLPPGTSKWNKIEHRLFSAISRNWPGRPLQSHEVAIEAIGLRVHAELDTATYPRGITITDRDIAHPEADQFHRHDFRGDWHYTITAANPTARRQPPAWILHGPSVFVGDCDESWSDPRFPVPPGAVS